MNFCPYCGGKIVSHEAKFCMSCGKSLANIQSQSAPKIESAMSEHSIDSKMDGFVFRCVAKKGETVKKGDVLMTLKTFSSSDFEYEVCADADAIVKEFVVNEGQDIQISDKLVILASSAVNAEVLPPAQSDDFFDDLAEASNGTADAALDGDDFFTELDTASKREDSATLEAIAEAEKYFLRGEFRRAESLLEPLADKGYDRANYMLAVMYELGGNGVVENTSAALDVIGKTRSSKNNDLCSIHLFNFFTDEQTPNYAKANQLIADNFARFESPDDPLMMFELAYYLGDKNPSKTLTYLRASEQHGYWLASHILGRVYEGGKIVEQNYRKACEHYVRAANKGLDMAAKQAGLIYKYAPDGVTQDLRLAKKYLLIAAKQNDEEAMHELADVYSSEGNFRESINWLEKNVSTNGSAESAAELGVKLLNLSGNPKMPTDLQRAYQYFQFALDKDQSNATALFGMGFSYIAGEAVSANEQTALSQLGTRKRSRYGDRNFGSTVT